MDDRVTCLVMVEDLAGLEHLNDIVEDVDGVYIGPKDLT